MKHPFSIYLFITLLLSGCATIPEPADYLAGLPFMKSKQQKEDEAALVTGDYDNAANLLQQAAIKKPGDKKIKVQLTEARSKAAELHVVRAEKAKTDNNPRLTVSELEKALQYKEMPAIRERLIQARSHLSTLAAQVSATITTLNSPHNRAAAIDQAENLMVYLQSFPKLEPALNSARKQAGISSSNQANQLIHQRKFTQALAAAKQAVKLSHESSYQTQVRAIEKLLDARQKSRDNNLVEALALVTQAKKLLPENSAVALYQSELLADSSGQLFNEAIRASRSGRYLDAIERLELLQSLNPDFAETDQQLRMNRLRFSNENRLQAEALEQSEGNQAVGRTLIHYLVAQHYDPHSYELEDEVLRARKLLRNKIELRVSIDFTNESREPGANIYVRDRVLDGLRASNISNLTILEREAIDEILREQGMGQGFLDESTTLQVKKIRGIQTGVKGSVLRVAVRESGRERPSYDSVRYQNGTRFIPNPAYRNRQADVTSARQHVYQAQQALNQALANKQNSPAYKHNPSQSATQNQLGLLSQVISDGEASRAQSDLSDAQSSLNDAEYRLASEPSRIEEPAYANARYPIYNLRLDGEVQISFRLIDFTTSAIGHSHNVHIKDSVSDRYVAGDPGKGIADDPDELPPSHLFKEQLMNRAIKDSIEKLNAEFSGYSQRFLKQARRAREHGVNDEAAEYYFRYLAAISSDSGDEIREARQYIKSQYGVAVAP